MKTDQNPVQAFIKVLDLEAGAIGQAAARLSSLPQDATHPVAAALAAISECLDRGGRVVVTGVGKSGKIAQKISATLSSTGTPSLYLHPTEGLHGDLGMITGADLVLALSHTGNTDELLRLIPAIKSLRVPVIGLGGNAESQLGKAADIWLDGSVAQEACPHNLAPTSSTTLALAIGDALAVALMELRGFDASAFARNHPGGALGRRLHLKVSDVLHDVAATPMLGPDATVEEVLDASSRRNLGAVLIVDSTQKLLGIITDGDLRRALKHREKFFSLRARDLMTAKPVCISPDALAFDALERMENRPSQIKELPVVDQSNRVIGLVRIHDLLKFF
jgi:arabinose-5-phosphate isomerase